MEWLKFLPLLFRGLELVTQVREDVRQGKDPFDIIKQQAPGVIDLFAAAGAQMWPNLSQQQQVAAGAQRFDIELVKSIQTNLNKLGALPVLNVDGSYGKLTKDAVTAFQKAHGLVADGWAGKLTQAKMAEELAKLGS